MTVFVNDNWELDTKTGVISINSPFGKKAIAEVFGATDFNIDNEQAMTHAKIIKVAPKMYCTLKALSAKKTQIKRVSALINKADEIVREVEGVEAESYPITRGKWYIRGEEGDDWINPNYGIYSDTGGLTYIVGYVTRRGTEEGLANAKLISAAPEMYEFLCAFLDDKEISKEDVKKLLARINGTESDNS